MNREQCPSRLEVQTVLQAFAALSGVRLLPLAATNASPASTQGKARVCFDSSIRMQVQDQHFRTKKVTITSCTQHTSKTSHKTTLTTPPAAPASPSHPTAAEAVCCPRSWSTAEAVQQLSLLHPLPSLWVAKLLLLLLF